MESLIRSKRKYSLNERKRKIFFPDNEFGEEMQEVGDLIRSTRIARNLTQIQMGEMFGFLNPNMCRYEKGNIRLTTALKVFEALNAELTFYSEVEFCGELLKIQVEEPIKFNPDIRFGKKRAEIGELIRLTRTRINMTREELGELSGLTAFTIKFRYEVLPPNLLIAIFRVFKGLGARLRFKVELK